MKLIDILRGLDPTITLFQVDRAVKGIKGVGKVAYHEIWKWSLDERSRLYKQRREGQ